MALFKIQKGTAANLKANRPYTNEGYCYFTTDDGKFYIDVEGTGSNTDLAYNNNTLTSRRICLNAATADQVANSLILKINNGNIDGRSRYEFDGSAERTINFATNGEGFELIANSGTVILNNTGVTSIKGGSESTYRTGQVNLTASNIIGTTAIGGPTIPVYWTGSAFAAADISGVGSANFTIRRWESAAV